jgi:hypothetical protein
MVESHSTHVCAVFVLRRQCLNGHCIVMNGLHRDMQIPKGIAHAQEAQAESLPRLVGEEGKRYSLFCPREVSLCVVVNRSPNGFA